MRNDTRDDGSGIGRESGTRNEQETWERGLGLDMVLAGEGWGYSRVGKEAYMTRKCLGIDLFTCRTREIEISQFDA
jgi:hypothetical protein